MGGQYSAAETRRLAHSGGGCGESQFLMYDVVLPQRNDEKYTKETSANSYGDKLSDVFLGNIRHEIHAVHRRYSPDEKDTQASGSYYNSVRLLIDGRGRV